MPADIIPAAERPDAEYPMVLITGRQLEHWHTGSDDAPRRRLDSIEPEPVASMHPLDLEALGVAPGDVVTIESRRGEISLYARADDGTPRGAVFVPFCYYEAAANMLTNPVLDPFGKPKYRGGGEGRSETTGGAGGGSGGEHPRRRGRPPPSGGGGGLRPRCQPARPPGFVVKPAT